MYRIYSHFCNDIVITCDINGIVYMFTYSGNFLISYAEFKSIYFSRDYCFVDHVAWRLSVSFIQDYTTSGAFRLLYETNDIEDLISKNYIQHIPEFFY